jgi:ribosomal protein L11 methyltransferase
LVSRTFEKGWALDETAVSSNATKQVRALVNEAAIKETVSDLLSEECSRLTPSDLECAVRRRMPSARRNDIRQALRELVSLGSIVYTQHHSTTYLENNYHRPVRISDRIVLTPPGRRVPERQDRVVIQIMDGAAFGGGDHPTTRMMLCGLDDLLKKADGVPLERALDIGTGTGVLAIAAAALGFARVDAVDIDPVACFEAKQNAILNGVDHGVHVSQNTIEPYSKKKYNLIMANLRPPTIVELLPMMSALSSSRTFWMISGCRMEEGERLKEKLPTRHSNIIWQAASLGWSAFTVYGEPACRVNTL